MAKTVIYQHGTDNAGPNGTWAHDGVLGTEDTDYPATNLSDEIHAKPAKLTTTTGGWIWSLDAGVTRQRVDLVALGVHNIDAGATVAVQGNDTASWGSPTLNTTLTIAAADADGRVCHAWKDLTGVTGYTTAGFYYWRIAVTASNTSTVAVGEVWLGALKRTFDRNYRWRFDTTDRRRTVQHVTQYGARTVYDLLVRERQFRATLRASDTGLAAVRAWHRSCRGSVKPSVFIPDASVNDAWWVYLPDVLPITSVFSEVHDLDLLLDEVSPGLPL